MVVRALIERPNTIDVPTGTLGLKPATSSHQPSRIV